MDTNEVGIYSITSPSGKKYIGMTCSSFRSRWDGHFKELRRGSHKSPGLQRAYHKYGLINLKFEILEAWSKSKADPVLILQREQAWWDHYASSGVDLYNGRPTGTGSVFHTKKTKEAISLTAKMKLEETYFDFLQDKDRFLDLVADQSMSLSKIAREYGTTIKRVRGFLSYLGVKNTSHQGKMNLMAHDLGIERNDLSQIVKNICHEKGNLGSAARVFGVSEVTIHNELKKLTVD